jgi:ABC-2 type transport system ATP-binding protein
MNAPIGAPAVRTDRLSRRFGGRFGRPEDAVTALDDVSLTLAPGAVHGLLGRNGAGKTTLMRILAGQDRQTCGRLEVFEEPPLENPRAARRTCLIREGQRYPDGYRVRHVLSAAQLCFPHWDTGFATRLLDTFELPAGRPVRKLSRGMLSAIGIVVGLAARAPLTLFDEPYLGLDAALRQRFYDQLLIDLADRPRTVVISTHLIDEIADLLEHVILLDHGRVLLDADAEALRQQAVTITGPVAQVERVVAAASVLDAERLGGTARVTVRCTDLDQLALEALAGAGLHLEPVALQRLIVLLTNGAAATHAPARAIDRATDRAPAPSEGALS